MEQKITRSIKSQVVANIKIPSLSRGLLLMCEIPWLLSQCKINNIANGVGPSLTRLLLHRQVERLPSLVSSSIRITL